MRCAVCDTDVPAGAFCGTCGAHLSAHRGNGRGVLRAGAYAAAPGEHVLRLSVASSLFPHLPHRSRAPFRVALSVLFLALIAFALLGWQAPLIAVSALGLPLLFVLYLHETDIDDDLPVSTLALTAALGVGLGVGWSLLTGSIVAESYDVALSEGTSAGHSILEGLVIPAGSCGPHGPARSGGAAAATRDPRVVGRVRDRRTECDRVRRLGNADPVGSPIRNGADGAGPTGQRASRRGGYSRGGNAVDRRRDGRLGWCGTVVHPTRGYGPSAGGCAASFEFRCGAWPLRCARIDGGRPSFTNGLHFGLHLLVAVFALLALRIGLQAALLHEAHDEMNPGAQVLCPHCDHVVPDTAFCPNCGVATRAASRTARAARRTAEDVGVPDARPGYAVPAGTVCGGAGAAHHPHPTADGVGCGCERSRPRRLSRFRYWPHRLFRAMCAHPIAGSLRSASPSPRTRGSNPATANSRSNIRAPVRRTK